MPSTVNPNSSRRDETPRGLTPTPNARSDSAMQAPSDLFSSEPSDDPCCHEIHPAYKARYNYPCCPQCRLLHSIDELEIIEETIRSKHQAVGLWRQRIRECTDPVVQYRANCFWLRLVRGGDRVHPQNANKDDNGKDWSLRHVQKRLYNTIDKVRDLADQEAKWAHENAAVDESSIPRPATTVLNHYYQLLRTGKLNHLVAFEVYFARIRGREWVISLDPKYPEDSSDRAHDYSHYYLKTPEQRAFIKASTVPLAEQKEYSQTSRRKSRRAGAKVTFAPEIFVRSEADIDVLRKQALSSSKITRNTFSWLRALFAKVFAKPLFEVRDLCDGPYRPQINYRRPYNVGALGTWSAPKGSVTVNTSGDGLKGDYDSWDKYVKKLGNEAKVEDAGLSDLRAVFEDVIVFAVVWSFLFSTCILAESQSAFRWFFRSGRRSQEKNEL
jgi:hypothetical protein